MEVSRTVDARPDQVARRSSPRRAGGFRATRVQAPARALRALLPDARSVQDAEDALQESLLGAWQGLAAFEGRSSVRAWLYTITTNACLRLISRTPRRILSPDYAAPRGSTDDLGAL